MGRACIQLCRALQLRTVAVIRRHPSFDKTAEALQSLGASHVLADEGSLKVHPSGSMHLLDSPYLTHTQAELEALSFFGKPRLALDCVGGRSAARICDTLIDVRFWSGR